MLDDMSKCCIVRDILMPIAKVCKTIIIFLLLGPPLPKTA